ncbi:MAG: tRNA pseudouridine(54/55) synthase Pus10 [Candidatus Nanohaloarchaea archaeon]
MKIGEKASQLLQLDLCDHCLGRQFAQLGHGLENHQRGKIVRKHGEKLKEKHFEERPESSIGGSCDYCQGIFDRLDEYVEMVMDSMERYELETFLVGIRPPETVLKKEEDLWEEHGLEYTEPIKTELSRLIGKQVEEEMDVEVDFERPDIMTVLDMREGKNRVELQVNSLLFYGEYNKYTRKLPQTEWPCSECGGSGCDECNWTGQQFEGSIQEIIQKPFIEATGAIDAKFHGAGREDIDVECRGRRPFVIELREPLERTVDLEKIQEKINEDERVEVFNLEETHHNRPEEVKDLDADKTYRAWIQLEDLDSAELEKLEDLEGTVVQRTPSRVEHRRADKHRERKVKKVDWKTEEGLVVLDVKAEAGTYIKELIHGDDGRSDPSVAGLLGQDAECVKLDVIEIDS